MKSVEAGDQRRDRQDHENQMTGNKVGRVQAHFDDLDDELSSGLTEYVCTQATVEPDTGPPSSVGLVMLELSRKEDGDKDLEDASLNGDDGDHTQYDMRSVPQFEPPHEFEECNKTDDGTKVGDGGHDSTKLVGVTIQLIGRSGSQYIFSRLSQSETYARAKEQGNKEQNDQQRHVPDDGTQTNDRDSEQTGLSLALDGERLDEQVGDNPDNCQSQRS